MIMIYEGPQTATRLTIRDVLVGPRRYGPGTLIRL